MYKISSASKEPYPNKQLTICLDAISNANVAGSESSNDSSIDLFCIKFTEF